MPELYNKGIYSKNLHGKFLESLKTDQFLRCEPFNRKLPEILGVKLNERKFLVRNFRKFAYISRGCPFFLQKFREMLFQSEISGNSKWKFSAPKVMKPDNAVFLASFDLI